MCSGLRFECLCNVEKTSYERLYTTLSRRISFLLRTPWRCIPRSAEGAPLILDAPRDGAVSGAPSFRDVAYHLQSGPKEADSFPRTACGCWSVLHQRHGRSSNKYCFPRFLPIDGCAP